MAAIVVLLAILAVRPAASSGQEAARKVTTKVQPSYPELAKRLNLSGTVKIQVVVAPNGTVKSAKPLGGNPVFIEAAVDAVKKWHWEAGPAESTEVIDFRFVPNRQQQQD